MSKTASKTLEAKAGFKTTNVSTRWSFLNIANKDPECDYSFRQKATFQDLESPDNNMYVPVTESNHSGETWAVPMMNKVAPKTASKKTFVYQDTILCKRPKEISAYFQAQENKKYNAQKSLIKEAAQSLRVSLRNVDPNSSVEDTSEISQRRGTTEKGD